MTRIVKIMAGDTSAVFPLALPSSPSLIPVEHPSEAAAAAAAAAADAAAAAAASTYINGGGFYKPTSSPDSAGCGEWQLVDQQHRQRLSFHTGWAKGLRVVPVLKDINGGHGGGGGGGGDGAGEFDDGSEEFVAVVWNDLAGHRRVLHVNRTEMLFVT
jgi:hypothetical protein